MGSKYTQRIVHEGIQDKCDMFDEYTKKYLNRCNTKQDSNRSKRWKCNQCEFKTMKQIKLAYTQCKM